MIRDQYLLYLAESGINLSDLSAQNFKDERNDYNWYYSQGSGSIDGRYKPSFVTKELLPHFGSEVDGEANIYHTDPSVGVTPTKDVWKNLHGFNAIDTIYGNMNDVRNYVNTYGKRNNKPYLGKYDSEKFMFGNARRELDGLDRH